MAILPGPDFPGGGQIISAKDEIRTAYETGRGSIAMRARWTTEQLARGQWRIVVTELPHGVSVRQVLEEIEALVNPKPSTGKKEVSQEQRPPQAVHARADRDGARRVRPQFEAAPGHRAAFLAPERRGDMKTLLVQTSLETRYALNLTWLGLDGLPETKDNRSHPPGVGRVPPRHRAPPHRAPPDALHRAARDRDGAPDRLRQDR